MPQIAKQWDPAVKGGHCVSAVPFYTTMASLTILFDLLMYVTYPLLAHPLRGPWSEYMATRRGGR